MAFSKNRLHQLDSKGTPMSTDDQPPDSFSPSVAEPFPRAVKRVDSHTVEYRGRIQGRCCGNMRSCMAQEDSQAGCLHQRSHPPLLC